MDALAPVGITALIFGGCCTNVYALEAILKRDPNSGLLITLLQFILVSVFAYPSQRPKNGGGFLIRRPRIPYRKLLASAAMFFAVNMLNNWAFAFNISVPVHIILRSFGSVTTMAAGWLRGKKYSPLQVLSVGLLTVGVLISAWADAQLKGKKLDAAGINIRSLDFELGILVLIVAQFLAAWMGVYTQDVYAEHGKHWDENLFYSHFLSLPMFFPLQPQLDAQYQRLIASPPLVLPDFVGAVLPPSSQKTLSRLPNSLVMLVVNSVTQLLCITGVNMLSARSSAVTVTIVLNIRKLVSFMLSIWLFGNHLSNLMVVGATLVFGAGALYGWETTVGIKTRAKASEKQKTG